MLPTIFKTIVLAILTMQANSSKFTSMQKHHEIAPIQKGTIHHLASLSDVEYTNEILDNILIPRVVGTKNHEKVFKYIKSELENLDWSVEVDSFEDQTPFGKRTFKNIIATLDPQAERYLVLACHYDSKFYEDITFVGATDSAVPCAMLLNLAKVMRHEFKKIRSEDNPITLKLVFFDGEEAFEKWGPKDSIYGAKHLAEIWERNRRTSKLTDEIVSDLERIDVFILLDLIGHRGTRFLSCFENTQKWFMHLANIEDALAKFDLLENNRHRYFERKKYLGYIEDDHVPFLLKHVPVLHLISIPFPDEWHTKHDNRDIIHTKTVEDINKILRIFVKQYLNVIIEEPVDAKIPPKEL